MNKFLGKYYNLLILCIVIILAACTPQFIEITPQISEKVDLVKTTNSAKPTSKTPQSQNPIIQQTLFCPKPFSTVTPPCPTFSPTIPMIKITPTPPIESIMPSPIISISPSSIQSFYNNFEFGFFTIRLHVYDENDIPLSNINFNAKILTENVTFDNGKTEISGQSEMEEIVLNGTPCSTPIKYTVHKEGMTKRIITYKSYICNSGGILSESIYFGIPKDTPEYVYQLWYDKNIGGKKFFLSNKPEVTSSMPVYNSTNVQLNTPVKLNFSEPVDTKSVEDNFIIKVIEPGSTSLKTDDIIFTSSYYTIAWNTNYTEVTFTPKNGNLLPTSLTPPKYAITFKSPFKDKDGNSSNIEIGAFRVEPDNFSKSLFTVVSGTPIPSSTPTPVPTTSPTRPSDSNGT